MPDHAIAYSAGIHALITLNEISPLQDTILTFLRIKQSATSTAILNHINHAPGITFRSQSAVSHSISDLVSRGYLEHIPYIGHYRVSFKGYEYLHRSIKLAYNIENFDQALLSATQQTKPSTPPNP